MEVSAGSFSGTAANVVALAEEPWVLKFVFYFSLKSFTSMTFYCTKSKLASFMGWSSLVNGIFLLRSQIGKAFSAQNLEFRRVNRVKSSAIFEPCLVISQRRSLAGLCWKSSGLLRYVDNVEYLCW